MRAAGGPCARRGMLDAGARSRHDVVGTHRSKERLSAAAQRCRAGLVVVSLKDVSHGSGKKIGNGSTVHHPRSSHILSQRPCNHRRGHHQRQKSEVGPPVDPLPTRRQWSGLQVLQEGVHECLMVGTVDCKILQCAAGSDAVWRGRFRRELDAVARRTDRVAAERGAAVPAGAGVRRKLGHRAPGAGSSRLLQCGRGSFGGPARYTPQRAPGPTPRPAPVRGRLGSCTLFPPTSLTGGAGPAPVLEPRDGALTTLHRIVVVRLQFERLLLVDADGPGGGGVRLPCVGRLAV